MSERFVNVVIGGAAGQGLVTMGQLLAKSVARAGYQVAVTQVYMSRVRGGHNTFALRMGASPVPGPDEDIDLLVAMNQETVDLHAARVRPGGFVILGEGLTSDEAATLSMPLKELAPKPIFYNVVGLGVLGAVLGIGRQVIADLLQQTFGKKGEKIVAQNHEVLDAAYAWATEHKPEFAPLGDVDGGKDQLLMNGNEAIALGAMAAGANFCSFYPMTPGTSIAQNLITKGKSLGVVVEQVEDEIAAINMALGASYAGGRAIVPTSGGGFALMTEGVSMAGVGELPVVCAIAQRPGPATGLPTHTEQADLNLALYAGHGEFPRAIMTPGTVEECFHLAYRAMDQAERYQTPVIILTDQYLADSLRTIAPFDLESLPEVARPARHDEVPEKYQRYAETQTGVSPRLLPGFGEHVVVADSHEHLPDGHITERPDVRNAQNEKRLRKEVGLREDTVAPSFYGDDAPDCLLVCWGSSVDATCEAAEVFRARGGKVGVLHFSQVWPLRPGDFKKRMQDAKMVVCIEANATGQFAALLRKETGLVCDALVLRYDGLPFTAEFIVGQLEEQGCTGEKKEGSNG
jgi:2-oxoglutarate ferredoxin oxidoreductase subunit alpha